MIRDLQFKKPEQEGLSSKHILEFIKRLEDRKVNLHSFLIYRNGHIITEAYYKPFDKNFQHRLYSSSKTIVSLAIGKLVGENKIKLTDKLKDLMPELVEKEQDEWMSQTTVEDALKMSVPMLTDTYFERDYKEWAWTFFNHPTRTKGLKPSGTVFNYNTSGSFILDVLVEKITGKTFLEYLRPEFDKVGVSKDIWCVKSPDGYAWGGSGVVCTLRDFASIGELVMHKGNFNGEQLIPLDYMQKATSKQISNITNNVYHSGRSAGYGYQIWIGECGYDLLGMGSQLVYCFPDKDFMFVCQGDTQSENDTCQNYIYENVKYLLYDNLDKEKDEDERQYQELQQKINSLNVDIKWGEAHSSMEKFINGKKYDLKENHLGWKWCKFDFFEGYGVLSYENRRGEKQIKFGYEKTIAGTFPEKDYYDVQVDTPANRELNSLTAGGWISDNQFLLRVYVIDTNFGNMFATFGFKNDEVGILASKRAEFFMDDYAGYAGGKISK